MLMRRRRGTWLALDFEMWEWDHHVLLECGYSRIRAERWGEGENEAREIWDWEHWIVRENKRKTKIDWRGGANTNSQ